MLQLELMDSKKFLLLFKKFWQVKYIFLANLLMFCLLLARNPYSQRTLIPNFQPYPDTFHYVVPARSLASEGPFTVIREGRSTTPAVPPLYSIFLTAFYIVNSDPRFFYVANVVLALASFMFFYKVVVKVTTSKPLTLLALFLYVSNYYMYWYPHWAMAENLFLFLFMLSILLLLSPINFANTVLGASLPVLVYANKYALLPYSLTYLLLFSWKLFIFGIKKRGLWFRWVGLFIVTVSLVFIPVSVYEKQVSKTNFFVGAFKTLINISSLNKEYQISNENKVNKGGSWFSREYIGTNFPRYIKSFLGNADRLLWEFRPLYHKWVGVLAAAGIIIGIVFKRHRFLVLSLAALLFVQILSISTFYAFDNRYVIHVIPTAILFFVIFSDSLLVLNRIRAHSAFITFGIFFMALYYLFTNGSRIKSQVMINIKYAETPWYYISVKKLNDYFATYGDVKPYVISPLPPYYIDFFTNGKYVPLPISPDQEFRDRKQAAWGDYDYSNLLGEYKK